MLEIVAADYAVGNVPLGVCVGRDEGAVGASGAVDGRCGRIRAEYGAACPWPCVWACPHYVKECGVYVGLAYLREVSEGVAAVGGYECYGMCYCQVVGFIARWCDALVMV